MKRRESAGSDASRRYHDRVARRYDGMYDDAYWQFHDRLTWAAIQPYLPADATAACCDLGCGTGKWGLKLLKSGFATTFVDHSAAMIGQVQPKLGPREKKSRLLVGDIVDLHEIGDASFALTLAMGDPLSICSEAARATREMFRICRPGGVVIATADNHSAALDHYVNNESLEELEEFVMTGRTRWLTQDERERFTLTTFTPGALRKMFEQAGFQVIDVTGKTMLPLRQNPRWLAEPEKFERLLRLEQRLAHDTSAAAAASHLQIRAKRI